jgi:hypothetical protein
MIWKQKFEILKKNCDFWENNNLNFLINKNIL